MLHPSKVFYDTKKIENTVLIAGIGRSGTTFLSELLNYKNDYRIMFEPFHKYKVPEVSKLDYKLYIPSENNNINLKQLFSNILSGKIKNKWIDQYNMKYFCKKRLVKEIRINPSLKWVKLNFPTIPIVYIIRHPCAVTLSKMRLNWEDHLSNYITQNKLLTDYLEPYINSIKLAQTDFEKHILMWCIENMIVLRSFQKNEILIIFYEHLLLNPEKILRKVTRFINMKYSNNLLKYVNRPSLQTNSESAILKSENLLTNWQKYINDEQKDCALSLLNQFNLNYLYNLDSKPCLNEDANPFRI